MKPLNLQGQRFGKLTVIKRVGSDEKGQSMWLVKCDCGTEKIVRGHDLKGGTSSCGCSRRYNTGLYKHGLSNTRIHSIWRSMIDRCYNPNNYDYRHYGERGIKMCELWKNDFMSFYNWAIENGYSESLTIDRIDTNSDYCPENCRWVNRVVQANNRRSNHFIEYNGEKMTVAEWSRKTGISSRNILNRLRYGFEIKDVLDPNFKREYHYKNEKNKEIKELCVSHNIPYKLVIQRVRAGWDIEKALNTPSRSSRKTI